jgi:crotonobetainyl-CoA:carnitine CoA-transferase CaiB-like acyl-CoA transferase
MSGAAGAGAGAPLPLDGVRVLELGQLLAAPCAGMILADLGASVVKVEAFGGDPARELQTAAFTGSGTSPTFLAFNRGKRSIALDLQTPDGIDVVRRLAARSDVLIESFRPGVMDRLGIDAAALRGLDARLIYASLSGFGHVGPEHDRRGVDLVIQAESGIMAVTGQPDGPPTKVGFTVVDVAAGHVLAQAILAALIRRGRTGCGDHVTVSLVDVALHLQSAPMTEYLATGTLPPRAGNAAPMTAPADLFRTRDGHLVISAYLDRHWRLLCDSIGRPDLPDDARFLTKVDRVRHRDELVSELESTLRTDTSRGWMARLHGAGLAVGMVKTYADIESDPQVHAMGTVISVGESAGAYRTVRLPAQFASWSPTHSVPAPRIGEHTDEVLREIGCSDNDIARLAASGATRTATAAT